MNITVDAGKVVTIDYKNWAGERRLRRIQPIRMEFGSNVWHHEPQWLLVALDLENGEERAFAMKDIHSWSGG
jgi:predicted DNA-binding transcriptional regulator YafY